jgi:hypothetical protein
MKIIKSVLNFIDKNTYSLAFLTMLMCFMITAGFFAGLRTFNEINNEAFEIMGEELITPPPEVLEMADEKIRNFTRPYAASGTVCMGILIAAGLIKSVKWALKRSKRSNKNLEERSG